MRSPTSSRTALQKSLHPSNCPHIVSATCTTISGVLRPSASLRNAQQKSLRTSISPHTPWPDHNIRCPCGERLGGCWLKTQPIALAWPTKTPSTNYLWQLVCLAVFWGVGLHPLQHSLGLCLVFCYCLWVRLCSLSFPLHAHRRCQQAC